MKSRIPLGQREDYHLEFKSAAALERPEIIGREVVAMLNAEGGEIWVGLRDEDGLAVELEGVPHADRAAESLLDSLVERLDPTPAQDEVRIEPVALDDEHSVLKIVVQPKEERRPYAFLKSGGWHFPVRIGNRVRKMTRNELFGRGRQEISEEAQQLEAAIDRVLRERDEFQKSAGETMWLRLQPVPELAIDVQSPLFEKLLADPARTGNREIGWHFAGSSAPPRLSKEKLVWSQGQTFQVEIRTDGAMTFDLSLPGLRWKGEDREIWPLTLLEYPVSAFRLGREIYADHLQDSDPLVADLAFSRIRGWKLRPGSPAADRHFWSDRPAIEYPGVDPDLTWQKPLVFRYREIREEPDRCGYRLVRRVYEAFGLPEKQMPPEFDRRRGRLVL